LINHFQKTIQIFINPFIFKIKKGGDIISSYIILDIETTGLSKHYHRITEIAAVKFENNKVVDQFETLINPQISIPAFITSLTGITNEMVSNAPTIDKIMPHFLNFVGDSVIVAHNATFDHGFLAKNAERVGLNFPNKRLCTRKLANRLLPQLPSKKLSMICYHLGIKNKQEHRAMTDVLATVEVFSKFLEELDFMGINEQEHIMKFERSSIKKYRPNNF
jgi:DNA polymerase III subunit alpha, Gram-positive type